MFRNDFCIIEIMQNTASCLQPESRGKCLFCREGMYQMSDIIEDIAENRGQSGDIDLLIELGEAMKINCLCSLGTTAPTPAMSRFTLFPYNYGTHIKGKCLKAGT